MREQAYFQTTGSKSMLLSPHMVLGRVAKGRDRRNTLGLPPTVSKQLLQRLHPLPTSL